MLYISERKFHVKTYWLLLMVSFHASMFCIPLLIRYHSDSFFLNIN